MKKKKNLMKVIGMILLLVAGAAGYMLFRKKNLQAKAWAGPNGSPVDAADVASLQFSLVGNTVKLGDREDLIGKISGNRIDWTYVDGRPPSFWTAV